MRSSKPFFVGVDLVEFPKAKRFYETHRARLGDYFQRSELNYILSGRPRYKRLARLLAAKEACFKAAGAAWMGPSGFKSIRVLSKMRRLELNFIETKNHIVAVYRKGCCAC